MLIIFINIPPKIDEKRPLQYITTGKVFHSNFRKYFDKTVNMLGFQSFSFFIKSLVFMRIPQLKASKLGEFTLKKINVVTHPSFFRGVKFEVG